MEETLELTRELGDLYRIGKPRGPARRRRRRRRLPARDRRRHLLRAGHPRGRQPRLRGARPDDGDLRGAGQRSRQPLCLGGRLARRRRPAPGQPRPPDPRNRDARIRGLAQTERQWHDLKDSLETRRLYGQFPPRHPALGAEPGRRPGGPHARRRPPDRHPARPQDLPLPAHLRPAADTAAAGRRILAVDRAAGRRTPRRTKKAASCGATWSPSPSCWRRSTTAKTCASTTARRSRACTACFSKRARRPPAFCPLTSPTSSSCSAATRISTVSSFPRTNSGSKICASRSSGCKASSTAASHPSKKV